MKFEKSYKYGKSVKISNWQDRMLAYPFDNEHPNHSGASHYRTLGESDFVFIPKTTTQEQLESGVISKTESQKIVRNQIVSYRINNVGLGMCENHKDIGKIDSINTTYRDHYKAPKSMVEKVDCCENVLDPLLNRRPKCDFEMLQGSVNKFMDDHLTMLSEGRKK